MADSFQRQEFFHKERWREIVKRLLKVTRREKSCIQGFNLHNPENVLLLGTLELISNQNSPIKDHLDRVQKY